MTRENFTYAGGPLSANLIQATPVLEAISSSDQSRAAISGSYFPIGVYGMATAVLVITGTFSATLVFEATLDGATWFAANAWDTTSYGPVTGATAAGEWIIPCAAYAQVRVRCSVYSSGTVVVTMGTSPSSMIVVNVPSTA